MNGEAIRLIRKSRGLTQQELAKAAGIAQAFLSEIETGAANPSVETLDRIAAALGLRLKISFIAPEDAVQKTA